MKKMFTFSALFSAFILIDLSASERVLSLFNLAVDKLPSSLSDDDLERKVGSDVLQKIKCRRLLKEKIGNYSISDSDQNNRVPKLMQLCANRLLADKRLADVLNLDYLHDINQLLVSHWVQGSLPLYLALSVPLKMTTLRYPNPKFGKLITKRSLIDTDNELFFADELGNIGCINLKDRETLFTKKLFSRSIIDLEVLPNKNLILAGDSGGNIKLFNYKTDREEMDCNFACKIVKLIFLPQLNEMLFVTSNAMYLFDLDTFQQKSFQFFPYFINYAWLSGVDTLYMSAQGGFCSFNLKSKEIIEMPYGNRILSCISCGDKIFAGNNKNELLDVNLNGEFNTLRKSRNNAFKVMEQDNFGEKIALVCDNSDICIVDKKSGEIVYDLVGEKFNREKSIFMREEFNREKSIFATCACFNRLGNMLAVGGLDGCVRIYSVKKGGGLVYKWEFHSGVTHIEFLDYDKFLVVLNDSSIVIMEPEFTRCNFADLVLFDERLRSFQLFKS